MSVYLDPNSRRELPVIVIGTGPIGLTAAAQLAHRNETFIVLEQSHSAGSSQKDWGHVRLFTPWQYNIDPFARILLEENHWSSPDPEVYPTGQELRDGYLLPLAQHPKIKPYICYNHRVTGIARRGVGITEDRRMGAPFEVHCDINGISTVILGRAVIDASGTWGQPNSVLANGLALPNAESLKPYITTGVPNVLAEQQPRHAGKRTLVVGSGHSAMNVVRDLVTLSGEEPDTEVLWAIRRDQQSVDCGEDDSFLNERTLLRRDTRELVDTGKVQLLTGIRITGITPKDNGLLVTTVDSELPEVDHIVVCTGFRPDLNIERELRTEIFSVFECVYNLAELIDPERSACGTVPPHGVDRLRQPEPDFFILGSKSYGRCGTFLMYTGYEQARSVVADLCGDESATATILQLPDHGLCSACDAWMEEFGSDCACRDTGEDCCDEETEGLSDREVAHA